jgi:hypothetical protein
VHTLINHEFGGLCESIFPMACSFAGHVNIGPDMNASAADATYPICEQIDINFSPFEDRLVIKATRKKSEPATLLCTRRMTILVLQQLLGNLPELTGLAKTPGAYWQEVLQMAHQKAIQAKQQADQAAAESRSKQALLDADSAQSDTTGQEAVRSALFLASELTAQRGDTTLTLAFKGLPMPDAMLSPCQHEPVFAIPLQLDNVHQLIELLITKCQEAQWHLPLELPWLQAPVAQPSASGSSRTH